MIGRPLLPLRLLRMQTTPHRTTATTVLMISTKPRVWAKARRTMATAPPDANYTTPDIGYRTPDHGEHSPDDSYQTQRIWAKARRMMATASPDGNHTTPDDWSSPSQRLMDSTNAGFGPSGTPDDGYGYAGCKLHYTGHWIPNTRSWAAKS